MGWTFCVHISALCFGGLGSGSGFESNTLTCNFLFPSLLGTELEPTSRVYNSSELSCTWPFPTHKGDLGTLVVPLHPFGYIDTRSSFINEIFGKQLFGHPVFLNFWSYGTKYSVICCYLFGHPVSVLCPCLTWRYARSSKSAAFSSSILLLSTASLMDLSRARSYMSAATKSSASTQDWST